MQESKLSIFLKRKQQLIETNHKLQEKQQKLEATYLKDSVDKEPEILTKNYLPQSITKFSNVIQSMNSAYRGADFADSQGSEIGVWSRRLCDSGLFDLDYYRGQNLDIKENEIDAILHYLEQGAWQGLDPHPLFSTTYYLEQNPQLEPAKINPLIHYLDTGSTGKYNPHPLFDATYYLERNPDIVRAGINPLIHYLRFGAAEKRNPHPLFDSGYYLAQNPDVAQTGINPLVHYLRFGVWEQRDPHPLLDVRYYFKNHPDLLTNRKEPLSHYLAQGARDGNLAWSAQRLQPILEGSSLKEKYEVEYLLAGLQSSNFQYSLSGISKVNVYCSAEGNYFMGEIADLIAATCQRMGADTSRWSDRDQGGKNNGYNIVVAPHEFFYLGDGPIWAEDEDWLSRTVMVNVEQPQTSWFSRSFHYLQKSPLVFDINIKTATFLRRIGIPAYFLPLGYLEGYKPFSFCAWRPDLLALQSIPKRIWEGVDSLEVSWEQRPLDILFVGHLSDRRRSFFSHSSSWLHQYKCFLHIPPLNGPFLEGKGNALTTEAFAGLSQRSKILLNIHQSDLDYFEWHRIIFYGLWQKTLVLTETCHQIPGLIPGEHYLQCDLKDMESKIEWLLNTEEGRRESERIRNNGHQFLKTCFNLEKIMGRVLGLMKLDN
ncbi:MAG: hypothetical protein N5P05_001866 [Chroococcopsis gigantea SAG 12.99]|nr:hypothetical protein [Chlorogloea purpurea SAG 13.99]MDV3000260.1 hypothetical protein [Chroococcopsis gigantea SAG 12.99]